MDLLIGGSMIVGSVLGAIAGNLIASELYELAPTLARWLVRRAVLRLNKHQRERYEEEWTAHLDDCAGSASKLLHGLGCLICSRALRRAAQAQNARHGERRRKLERDENPFGLLSPAGPILVLRGEAIARLRSIVQENESKCPQQLIDALDSDELIASISMQGTRWRQRVWIQTENSVLMCEANISRLIYQLLAESHD
jgi:hypothetical protein